ncbi:hypothetical protein, partial [Heyndrickxia coagulans]|uniref:hypothetical protein n=1 Tax=Heyndrickxia coagulans TaxID=1398 RepID=UPI002E20A525|nr:hypothetical protein [Heyndrickxia coagulans]
KAQKEFDVSFCPVFKEQSLCFSATFISYHDATSMSITFFGKFDAGISGKNYYTKIGKSSQSFF